MVDVPQVSQPNALANLQSLATIGQNFGRDQYYNALAQKDQAAQAQAGPVAQPRSEHVQHARGLRQGCSRQARTMR
jgi:hypothetical protein